MTMTMTMTDIPIRTTPASRGGCLSFFVSHTHDSADSIDDALDSSIQGIRTLKISFFLLLGTTVLRFVVVLIGGSVALLADSSHNFSDNPTAAPREVHSSWGAGQRTDATPTATGATRTWPRCSSWRS